MFNASAIAACRVLGHNDTIPAVSNIRYAIRMHDAAAMVAAATAARLLLLLNFHLGF